MTEEEVEICMKRLQKLLGVEFNYFFHRKTGF